MPNSPVSPDKTEVNTQASVLAAALQAHEDAITHTRPLRVLCVAIHTHLYRPTHLNPGRIFRLDNEFTQSSSQLKSSRAQIGLLTAVIPLESRSPPTLHTARENEEKIKQVYYSRALELSPCFQFNHLCGEQVKMYASTYCTALSDSCIP